MKIDSLGFFRLEEEMMTMDGNSIRISCPNIEQKILCLYGIPAKIYIVYPPDCRPMRYVMLEFQDDLFSETRNEIFLRMQMSPDELHIVKRLFDESFAI